MLNTNIEIPIDNNVSQACLNFETKKKIKWNKNFLHKKINYWLI